jgi:hypothetical protein
MKRSKLFGALVLSLVTFSATVKGQVPSNSPPKPNSQEGSNTEIDLGVSWAKGQSTFAVTSRDIRFNWRWTAANGPPKKQFSPQKDTVTFWPTAIEPLAPRVIMVAGKWRAKTVVEIWEFETPQPIVVPCNMQGECDYPELTIPFESQTRVSEEAVVGRDIIYLMFKNPALPAGFVYSAFVQYFDSKHLYRLDVDSADNAVLTIVASPSSQSVPPGSPTVLICPQLANGYEFCFAADHPQQGYVYAFLTEANSSNPDYDPLVIYDSDRNGTLDGFLSLTNDEWMSQGWCHVETYATMY